MEKRNVALITGVTGQDGSYLAELLLEKGYDVHGTIRRSSVDYRERIAHLEGQPNFHLHYADLGDSMSLIQVMNKVKPTEVYNLAAQSHVQVSFDSPEFTADVDATGVLRILEAIRQCGLADTCRMYQASTSELYGKVEEVPQNENTPFHPYSPYAVAKQYGFWIVKEYREAYNMFCCSGILFNHESERRGETFVTRKITLAAARINGVVVQPGKSFSFSSTILPRTSANGYVVAPIYISGTVGTGTGGGVCQVSSTLYAAMLHAGLPATERYPHSLPVIYLPAGYDAAIAGTSKDLKFTNTFSQPLLIQASASGGVLTVTLSLQ